LLSLAKLSTVAETDLQRFNSQDIQAELQGELIIQNPVLRITKVPGLAYDDHLDVVEVQREMREEFEQIVEESNVRGRPSIDTQADILAQQLVPESVEEASVAVRFRHSSW
jgi:hypothetical protein